MNTCRAVVSTVKTCQRCGVQFGCGLSCCWCDEITMAAELRTRLQQQFTDCLCRPCLEAISATQRRAVSVVVRPMRTDEALAFLQIHRASVRGLAIHAYSQDVIDGWGATPDESTMSQFMANTDGEIRLIAELDGRPAGIGAIVPHNGELRACYVHPDAARRGVGTALVAEIERHAREHGLTQLDLEASLNAEAFYASLGYVVMARGETVLRNGCRMASVHMRKVLPTPL